jgi:hypothetical protein
MKAIDFPQRNVMLAEDQPEYETLPVFCEVKEVIDNEKPYDPLLPVPTKQIPWTMTACFELTDDEIAEIIATRKIWYRQCLFGNNFQPMMILTQKPTF